MVVGAKTGVRVGEKTHGERGKCAGNKKRVKPDPKGHSRGVKRKLKKKLKKRTCLKRERRLHLNTKQKGMII